MRAGEITLLLRKLAVQRGAELQSISSRLFDTTYVELKRIARRLLGSRPRSMSQTDLVHEAFLRLLNSPGKPVNGGHFFGSAKNAMRHALVDDWRRASGPKRGGQYLLEALGCDEPSGPAQSNTLRLDLRLAVDELPDDARRLFQLVYVEGRTCSEAAPLLGISTRVVERRLQALRATLRRKLPARGSA